ncbi:MAG: RsmE family RNA methyltransferase [Thermoanaerobaculia bacterium]|nr:RsmE family RNA methyltransferase [Thermoanaerobaculia bacterium]
MDHRFFSDDPIDPAAPVRLTGDEFHHAVRVRRLRQDERVEIFDRDGNAFRATVEEIGTDEVVLAVVGPAPSRESPLPLTLGLALIKPDKFELVLQKGTELGVTRFIPIVSARTEVDPEKVMKRYDRWRKIIDESVKQCGRSMRPDLLPPSKLEEIIERGEDVYMLDPEGWDLGTRPVSAILLVGPEGGFTDEERRIADEAGTRAVRIGPRRLRAETAAIAAVTLAQARWGDLQ